MNTARTFREELTRSYATILQKLATSPLSPMCCRFDMPEVLALAYTEVLNFAEQSLSWEAYSCWTSQVPAMCSRQSASKPHAYRNEWIQYTFTPLFIYTFIPMRSVYT